MEALTRTRTNFPFLVLAAGVLALAHAAKAQETCVPVVAQVVSLQGQIEIQRAGTTSWMRVERLDTRLCEGDRLRSGALSRAALLVSGQALLRVDQNTTLGLRASPDEIRVEFDSGRVYSISRFPRRYRIITPFVNAGVEGTEFLVTQARDQAEIAVYEGRVAAEDRVGEPGARQVLQSGQEARFVRGAPPAVRAIVNPADAVQWALYYPPIDVQPTEASRLLRLGRVDEAERALQAAPDSVDALALRAIIRVVKNDKKGALDLAQRAVAQDAKSVRAWLALSYAQQADFKIEDALASATRATALEPANSTAHARRAELLLSVGRIKDAEAAASAAVSASPGDSRARTVLGFAHLARLDTAAARPQLLQAAVLDSADPLPRLGLGLATIKDGKLTEGRTELEIASALDPQNALLRSYLGKAYSDELRDELAGVQLERAKQLDPRDPTAWFYNAIRLQALNRPGEALEELDGAIARNENRAVERSRFLLDQDQAARSASLAQIYADLGFEELAVTAATDALTMDPASPLAHRFLAEAYQSVPRYEVARVSEVLQSQLLQPVSAAPLPAQLQQIRSPVLLGTGPITPSFQEWNPLFARDRHVLSIAGVAGSDDTRSDEVIYGYYRGPRSLQLGQYHYETDGFRPNSDLKQDVYRVFYQEDLAVRTSVQAELSRSETEAGDTQFRFDPNNFLPNQRGGLDVTAFRLGGRHSFEPGSTLIASLIAQRRETRLTDRLTPVPIVQIDLRNDTNSDDYTTELQYLGRARWGDVVGGVGFFTERQTRSGEQVFTLLLPGFMPIVTTTSGGSELRHGNAYIYGYFGQPGKTRLLLGLSVDDVDTNDPLAPPDRTSVNPKLGLTVPLTTGTTVRFAAFRSVKRQFAANQSIEPTHVAGFNQFFDDANQARSWRSGVALDQNWSRRLSGGIELTRREIDKPTPGPTGALDQIEERIEWAHRAYLGWLITPTLAAGAALVADGLERDRLPPGPGLQLVDVETRAVPLTVSYHHPTGLFVLGRLTSVRQVVEYRSNAGAAQGERETFSVFDVSLGVRLPRRWGIFRLDAMNLFDEKFRYQDPAFGEGLARVPVYAPGRSVFARLQLNI